MELEWPFDVEQEVICPLCEREGCVMTDHHLIPVQKGGKAKDIASICKECHKQIHAIFTNDELAAYYASVDALKYAEQMRGFYKFIKKQDPLKRIKVKQSKRRRGKN